MDEVDFTVLAAKSVFTDMIDKCPPAETCRDAFDRTAKATIKMASSNGGFGTTVQAPRRPRAHSTHWTTANNNSNKPDSMTPKPQHRARQSDHQPFNFDLSLSDTLSSPTLSVAGEMSSRTPPLSQPKGFDADYMMQHRGSNSPSDGGAMKPELSAASSAAGSRRLAPQASPGGSSNAAFMGQQQQQFGLQGSPAEYPDAQTMDFLQTLGAAPNGGFGAGDPAQVDLGFGMNWEGLPNEYGDNQQMNPFDTFFFGGQQSGGGGSGHNGGMGL